MRIRSQPFPDAAALPYWLWDDDQALKAHPSYRQAKAGEQDAAIDLVWDLAIDFLSDLQAKLPLGGCCTNNPCTCAMNALPWLGLAAIPPSAL